MVSRRIKVAFVGCGAVASMDYFPALELDAVRERLEPVAVCDVAPERARAAAQSFGFPEVYTSLDDLLAQSPAEAVVLLTPIPFHFAQASAALAAGRHVYVQKTITTSYAQAKALVEQAAKLGLVLAAAPGQMLDPAHQAARDLIQRGVVGKICFARGHGSHPGHERVNTYGADPTWYYRPGGGPVMDVAVYPLHSLTGLLGPVKRVTAFSGVALPDRSWRGQPIDVKMDDNTLLLLDFGESVFAEVNGSFCRPAYNTPQIELYAEKGVVQLGGWAVPEMRLEVYVAGDVLGLEAAGAPGQAKGWYRPQGLTPALKHTVADLVHFVDCVRDGGKPVNSAAHAAHVVEVIEKGYLAARTGQAQPVESTF